MIAIPVYKCRFCGTVHSSSGVTVSNKLLLSLEMVSDYNKIGSIQISGRGIDGMEITPHPRVLISFVHSSGTIKNS